MKNFGEFFNNQVENAGTIILSHTDGMDEAKLSAAVELLRQHNATATVVTTPWGQLDGSVILAAMEEKHTLEDELHHLKEEAHHHHHEHEHHHHDEHCDCGCHEHEHHHHDKDCDCGCHDHEHHHHYDEDCDCGCHDHEHHHDEHCDCGCHEHEHHHHDEHCDCGCHEHEHHHHADEVFASWGVETAAKFTPEFITDALNQLGDPAFGMVLRAKGIVAGKDGQWIYFDYVPGEPDVRIGKAAVIGRLCVIGSAINEDKLKALFGV